MKRRKLWSLTFGPRPCWRLYLLLRRVENEGMEKKKTPVISSAAARPLKFTKEPSFVPRVLFRVSVLHRCTRVLHASVCQRRTRTDVMANHERTSYIGSRARSREIRASSLIKNSVYGTMEWQLFGYRYLLPFCCRYHHRCWRWPSVDRYLQYRPTPTTRLLLPYWGGQGASFLPNNQPRFIARAILLFTESIGSLIATFTRLCRVVCIVHVRIFANVRIRTHCLRISETQIIHSMVSLFLLFLFFSSNVRIASIRYSRSNDRFPHLRSPRASIFAEQARLVGYRPNSREEANFSEEG